MSRYNYVAYLSTHLILLLALPQDINLVIEGTGPFLTCLNAPM